MLLIGIFSLSCNLQAQDLGATRAMAQTAMQEGRWDAAEALWMRVQFFSGDIAWESSSALAEVHFQQGRFREAAEDFAYVAHLAPSDSLRQHCLFRAATGWLQVHDYAKIRERLQVMGPQPDSVGEGRRQFFLGMAAYGLGDFVMAEAHWGGCVADVDAQAKLHALFQEHARLRPRHPAVAVALSAVLPGLGQAYIGEPLRGVNALLLVGAIVGGGIYVGAVVGIADAIVLFGPPFIRYHIGGARRVGVDARGKLALRRAEILAQMLDLVAH